MDKSKIIEKITEIGTCEDDVTRRELLATLQEEVCSDYDAHAQLVTSHEKLTQDNENLRATNMRLFLKIGDSNKPKTDTDLDPVPDRKEFKDLFDEKGNLK